MLKSTKLWLLLLVVPGHAVAANGSLFQESAPISVTISAPMRELIRNRKSKPEYAARMQFADATGMARDMTIKLRTRGNSRLTACDYPPLRITIDAEQAVGTIFEGQGRIKMVTQCNRTNNAESWLLLEYGAYLAYNEITEYSFRVRRLEVTFKDTESAGWERKQTAFLIEPVEAAAARLQSEYVRPPSVDVSQYSKKESANNALFQYLIGNTDFAVKRGPKGEGCCHNGRLVAPLGSQKDWAYLPYDFDQAGIINTSYALPDPRFRIRNATVRVYRGFCWHNEELEQSIALFQERQENIIAALLPEGLSNSRAKRARQYIERFYSTISDPKALQREIFADCRGPDSLPIRETTVSES